MNKIEKKIGAKQASQELFALYHNGDCVECAQRYLADDSIDLIITDPPYGIGGDKLHKHYNRDESYVIEGYVEIRKDEYEEFSLKWIREAERVLRPGGAMYLLSGWTNLRQILTALSTTALEQVNHIIWKYNFGVHTRRKYVTSHYHILYLVRPGGEPTFNANARHSVSEKKEGNRSLLYADMEDVWKIDREYKIGQVRHKNELPTKLLVKMLQYSSNEGDIIGDFFAGSFSTAKVAKAMNRSSISFEISKRACEHEVPNIEAIDWGEKIGELQTGKDDRPKNQYKPWSNEDLDRLAKAYEDYRARGMSKKAAIDHLRDDFERGYFSILNALKKQGL